MKCMSRSTLGVGIGCINIFGFCTTIIYVIKVLCDFGRLKDEDKENNEDVWSTAITLLYVILAICIIAVVISGLLIVGIVKRRHSLMRPWICCAITGIFCHALRLVVGFFYNFLSGAPVYLVFSVFFMGLLFLSIQILIFYPIYKLYVEIREKGLNVPEAAALNPDNDNPPSYGDLVRKGEV